MAGLILDARSVRAACAIRGFSSAHYPAAIHSHRCDIVRIPPPAAATITLPGTVTAPGGLPVAELLEITDRPARPGRAALATDRHADR